MAKEIVLALGGGGVRGIAHLGIAQCLLDKKYKIAGIAGTSAGGLFGAVIAAKVNLREICEVVDNFFKHSSFKANLGSGPLSLISTEGLEKSLEPYLKGKNIEDLPIPFVATAVSLKNGEEIVLRQGDVMKAVMTTIAIPGFFPSQGEDILVDGGVLDPVPVEPARSLNPRLPVVAVVLNKRPAGFQLADTKVPLEDSFFEPIVNVVSRTRLGELLRHLSITVDVVNKQMSNLRLELSQPDVLVEPIVGHFSLLQKVDSKEMFDEGYRAMQNELPTLEKSFSLINSFTRIRKYSGKRQQ